MTPLADQAAEYAEEVSAVRDERVKLRRAFMAGALEAARHPPHQVLRECLDFAKTIGTAAERAQA
jgi:formiminotetrahydrofolate cyclodeaminase